MATLPLSDRSRPWQKSAAIPRVRELTKSETEPSAEYKAAFLLVLNDGHEFGDYHYPIADVIGGKLTAVWHAVTAAAAAVQGARSGSSIPAHDKDVIRTKLDAYYAKARDQYNDDSIEAPWKPTEAHEAPEPSGTRVKLPASDYLKDGTPVSWVYRSATGHGYVDGVHADADKAADVEYSLRQVDNHVSASGSKENSIVYHKRSDITVSTKEAVEAAAKRASTKHEGPEPTFRTFVIDGSRADKTNRTVEISFSSETPVNSTSYSNEVLSHAVGAVDLSRLNAGAPLLFEHDRREQIGKIEKAWIDPIEHKGKAMVRFSRNKHGDEIFQDVIDGIRQNVSVGFDYDAPSQVESNGEIVNLINHWTPGEISFVSMPADMSVGVGRAKEMAPQREGTVGSTRSSINSGESAMNIETVADKDEGLKAERARVAAINSIADKLEHKLSGVRDMARKAIEEGRSEAEFSTQAFDEMAKDKDTGVTRATRSDAEVGLTNREVKAFSVSKLIRAAADPEFARRGGAKFEIEVCDAYRAKAGNLSQNRGSYMIPAEVLSGQRALSASGSDIVATNLLAQDFIELLRNQTVVRQAGATALDGLVGNVAIPAQSGAATAYWLATDTTSLTESDQTFSQVTLTPHTVTAETAYSRQLLAQSTPAIEQIVRNDLALQIAIAIDEAAINGSGSSGQPKGILNVSGISTVALGTDGAAPTYESIIDLKTALMKKNAFRGKLAFLINGEGYGTLVTTNRSGTTYPVFILNDDANGTLTGQKYFCSQQVPNDLTKGTGTGLSAVVFGNFADLLVASWSGLELLVDPYSGASANQVKIYAYQMADIGVRHAESFAAIVDMITT